MKYLFPAVLAAALITSTGAFAYIHHWHGHGHGPYWGYHWHHGYHFGHWRDYSWVDWHRYHWLHDPGPGRHWIFVDGQYVLVDDGGVVVDFMIAP